MKMQYHSTQIFYDLPVISPLTHRLLEVSCLISIYLLISQFPSIMDF